MKEGSGAMALIFLNIELQIGLGMSDSQEKIYDMTGDNYNSMKHNPSTISHEVVCHHITADVICLHLLED